MFGFRVDGGGEFKRNSRMVTSTILLMLGMWIKKWSGIKGINKE